VALWNKIWVCCAEYEAQRAERPKGPRAWQEFLGRAANPLHTSYEVWGSSSPSGIRGRTLEKN